MLRTFLAVLALLFALAACSENPQKPSELIPESKYVELLVELQLVRSYGENADVDSVTVDSLAAEVYKRYGITGEQFRESHRYYEQFPQHQKERIEKAIEQLKMDQVEPKDTTSHSENQ